MTVDLSTRRSQDLLDEWRKVKPAIMALGVSYPEASVRGLATSLATDLDLALVLGTHLGALRSDECDGAAKEEWELAERGLERNRQEKLTAAREQLDELAAIIRGDAPGSP